MRAFMSDRTQRDERTSDAGTMGDLGVAWTAEREARTILAETEPESGATFYATAEYGADLDAGQALAEALSAFVFAPLQYRTPEGSLYCFSPADHRDCYSLHWARVYGIGGVPA